MATLFDFSRSALEFAANNKIPLLSIDELFKGTGLAEAINRIPSTIGAQLGRRNFEYVTRELSKRNLEDLDIQRIRDIVDEHDLLRRCFDLIDRHIDNVYTGLLESGELIFMRTEGEANRDRDILRSNERSVLTAQIHWYEDDRERWYVTFNDYEARYFFYLPGQIAEMWKSYEDAKASALQIKGDRFARFFVFNRRQNQNEIPFKLVRLDRTWLQQLIDEERGF